MMTNHKPVCSPGKAEVLATIRKTPGLAINETRKDKHETLAFRGLVVRGGKGKPILSSFHTISIA
jgi:hypothetical protein